MPVSTAPPTQYPYHTEPVAVPTLFVIVLVGIVVLLPIPLLRILLMSAASGPAAWILFQLIRRGRRIDIYADRIQIHDTLPRRTRTIPLANVRGHTVTRREGLAIVYELPKVVPPLDPSPYAISNAHPESHSRPRHRLTVTPTVDGIGAAIAQINTALESAGVTEPFDADFVMMLVRRLRLRNVLLIIVAVLATPLYVIVIARTIGSFK